MLEAAGPVEPLPVGDWQGRRVRIEALMAALGATRPVSPDIVTTSYSTAAHDGASIALRWYTTAGTVPGPAVVYIHGGGMILGTIDLYHATVAHYVATSGVPMLAVEYRVAPEHPQLTPVTDCYTALVWLAVASALLVLAGIVAFLMSSYLK